ncbi:MAG: class I SAM-dependent methyltransferase, partial [Candidatus Methanofastidiosia archaeon]
EEQIKRSYYDLVGQWNLPIVHMGGLAATEELLKMYQVDEKSDLLDVGCGTGFTAYQIAKKYGCHVVGIDISEKMVARAKERAQRENLEERVEFQLADVTQLPFEDESFDVMIMESFLNILGKADTIRKALGEVSRVTRTGGRVGANEVFADESTPPELLEHIRELLKNSMGPGQGLARFTPTEFKRFFEDARLQVVQITKKPVMDIGRDVIKVMGLIGFIRFSIRAIYDMITNSELRKGARKAAPAKQIMERRKDTKKFFGYVLIVGKKIE